MLVSQKIAIAAHLHVLLRRKTGRVTDTEWMASNVEYGLEIVRFTRAKALEDGHPDLNEWADKLEKILLEPQGKPAAKPLAQTAMQLLRERNAAPVAAPVAAAPVEAPEHTASGFAHSVFGEESGFTDSILDPEKARRQRDPNVPRYVGGIR